MLLINVNKEITIPRLKILKFKDLYQLYIFGRPESSLLYATNASQSESFCPSTVVAHCII